MKKFLLLAAFALLSSFTVNAQINNQPVRMQNYKPTGACTLPNQIVVVTVTTDAGLYQCIAGAWVAYSTGGGGGGYTPVSMFVLDGSRTDSYTPNGAWDKPFKTLDTLNAAIAAYASGGGAGQIVVWVAGRLTYSGAGITTGANPTYIYGNGATFTYTSNFTANGPASLYDLNTVMSSGTTFYWNYSGSTRSEVRGGAFTGNSVIAAGNYVHMWDTNLSGNSYSVTVNGTFYGDTLTGSQQIKSGASTAFIVLNNVNLIKSSGYNVDMSAGGVFNNAGGILSTASGTANVYLPAANSASLPHAISALTTPSGLGILCANGTTTYLAMGAALTASTYCTQISVYQGSTVFTGGITAPSVAAGAPSTAAGLALPSGSHGFACDESATAGVPASGVDYIRCDITTHGLVRSLNNGTEVPLSIYTPCSRGISNAGNAVASGDYYSYGACPNLWSSTYIVNSASVYSDNASGSSYCIVQNSAGNTVLANTTAASTSWTGNGTTNISGTYAGVSTSTWLTFHIHADGTSKYINCVLGWSL